MTILVVDDYPMNRKLLRATLEAEGFEVAEAENGQAALEALEHTEIHAVISDLLMPVMDGFRLCHEVRRRDRLKDIPFIVCSATYTSQTDEKLALEFGADQFLRKPVSSEAILKSLRSVLSDARPRHAGRVDPPAELAVVKEYSEVLVRKLEEKNEALELAKDRLEQANQALQRSNEEPEQFAYIACHDLQTPLRNISGFVQLLQASYADSLDEQANDWIRRSVQSAQQMHNLIRDLLDYSRVDAQALPFKPIPFRETVNDAIAILEASIRDSGGQVTCDDLPTVLGDRSQLVHLMQNLIGNGLKYHGQELPQIHISAKLVESEWVFSVRDNGIGIAPKHHQRVFEIFKRLHNQQEYPGTGIGLSICRRVVDRHGGKIWLESEAGLGSTFYFTIPAQTAPQV